MTCITLTLLLKSKKKKIEPARVKNNGDILGLIFVTSYDVKFTQRVSNKIR